MHYQTSPIHALSYAWSERLVGILAGEQHSALVVVVTCFHSFEHSSPSLCLVLYLVHAPLISLLSFASSCRVWAMSRHVILVIGVWPL